MALAKSVRLGGCCVVLWVFVLSEVACGIDIVSTLGSSALGGVMGCMVALGASKVKKTPRGKAFANYTGKKLDGVNCTNDVKTASIIGASSFAAGSIAACVVGGSCLPLVAKPLVAGLVVNSVMSSALTCFLGNNKERMIEVDSSPLIHKNYGANGDSRVITAQPKVYKRRASH